MATSTGSGKRRATLSLASEEQLRGTDSVVLLEGLGRRLRDTVGGHLEGAGIEDDYTQSFKVDRLTYFLSHSWHAWWFFKYVTLLLYLNGPASIFVGLFVGMCVSPCYKHLVKNASIFEGTTIKDWTVNVKDGQDRYSSDVRYPALFLGLIAFYGVLFSWHHLRKFFPAYRQTIFLDKVCIHQTDAELKALGIQSIGAILARSDSMLLAWDATYFDRLWCTFELAAFKSENKNRDIVFLPIKIGAAIAAFNCAFCVVQVCRIAFICNIDARIEYYTYTMTFYVPVTVMFVTLVHFARHYARDISQLEDQVTNFKVRDADCYCCDHGHIHPITGARMPCDRELVYASIAHWHGFDDVNVGLEQFDVLVRNELAQEIDQDLPGCCNVPYQWAVLACFPNFLVTIDLVDYDNSRFTLLFKLVRDLLLMNPAQIGVLFALSRLFPAPPSLEVSSWSLASRVFNFARGCFLNIGIGCVPAFSLLLYYKFLWNLMPASQHILVEALFCISIAVLDVRLFTNWSFAKLVASLQEKACEETSGPPPHSDVESISSEPSVQSTSSRPSAPSPQAPLPTRRLSARSTLTSRSNLTGDNGKYCDPKRN